MTSGSATGEARQSPLIDALHAAYLADDPHLFARAFPDQREFAEALDDLIRSTRIKRDTWEPSRAGLSLELAIGALDRQWPAGAPLLTAAMRQVVGRPAAPGRDAAGDRFESIFHYAALGALLGNGLWLTAERYVGALDSRISDSPVPGRAVLIDPGWPLMLGWIGEARTAPIQSGPDERDGLPSLAAVGSIRRTLERVESRLALATTLPHAPAEARVRRAFVLHRLGRNSEAALELAQVPPGSMDGDKFLRYWRGLIAGRVHEALGSSTEAERAYTDAHAVWPGAQTAPIALASLFERQGRPAEAERWIARVHELPADAIDPWWLYWTGDRRRVTAWLSEIRKARP